MHPTEFMDRRIDAVIRRQARVLRVVGRLFELQRVLNK
jgi:hypothetical protein